MERKSWIWGKMMYGKIQLFDSTPSLKAAAQGSGATATMDTAAAGAGGAPGGRCSRSAFLGCAGGGGGTRDGTGGGGPAPRVLSPWGSGQGRSWFLYFPARALFVPHLITA